MNAYDVPMLVNDVYEMVYHLQKMDIQKSRKFPFIDLL
jgi:hypothetical protein